VVTVYLDPGDVAAADARRVIDALNAATTARQLDVAIEFPGEPDIGVRLGQRLLDRRDELGGFTDLQQVRDVPLIGPERFTEIVVALSGRSVFELLGLAGAGGAVAPQPTAAVDLTVHQQGPYLGQLTTAVVTVTVDGRRRPGLEVLLTAGIGRLRAVTAGRVVEGAAITVVSAQDGTARATWSPHVEPPLPPEARAALTDALGVLAPAAPTPGATLDGLRSLVSAYRWEPNAELRRAVDVLTADLVVDTDQVDLERAWPRQDDTITAFVLAAGSGPAGVGVDVSASGTRSTPLAAALPLVTGGAVQAVAVRAVAPRDWRPALVRVHQDVVREQAPLASHLDTEQRESTDPVDLLGRVQRRVSDFLDVQLGRLGTDVASTIAVEASRGFVLERTADLSLDDRLQITPVVAATAGTLGTSSPAVVRALTETRSTVLHRLDERVDRELPPLLERVGTLADQITSKVDLTTFDDAVSSKVGRAELDEALADTVDRATFEEAVAKTVDRRTLDEALANTVDHATLEQILGAFVDRRTFDEAVFRTVDRAMLEEALERTVDRATLEQVMRNLVDRRSLDELLSKHVPMDQFLRFTEHTSNRLRRLEERG
jgi:hypothetical protein